MKKKLLIILISIIVILLAIFAYFVASDIIQENKLKAELNEISELTNSENINAEKIEEKLERIVTSGDYAIVESAVKNYLKDNFKTAMQITDTLQDPKITEILTVTNYKEDGKDFIETKKYINETIKTLENSQSKYQEFFTEEKALSYIENKGLDTYYIDFYKQDLIGDISNVNEIKVVTDSIDELIVILQTCNDIINLLAENPNSWQIQGENIVFNNEAISNKYNKLIEKLS